MEVVLAVSVVRVGAEVSVAILDTHTRNIRGLVLTEQLNKHAEVSPERISVTLFVAAHVSQLVDEGEDQDIVAVIFTLNVPEAHINELLSIGVRSLIFRRGYILEQIVSLESRDSAHKPLYCVLFVLGERLLLAAQSEFHLYLPVAIIYR